MVRTPNFLGTRRRIFQWEANGFEALFISLLPLDGEFDGPKGETIAKDRSKNSGKRNTALPQGPVTTTERGF